MTDQMVAAAGVAERWRDLELELWLVTATLAGLWLAALGLAYLWTRPRRVTPGPRTADLAGPEPPAVVNLIARGWRLQRSAPAATLLDLAARRFVEVEHLGERTYIRLLRSPVPTSFDDGLVGDTGSIDGLAGYERMVLQHIEGISHRSPDGRIPAEALATGSRPAARSWWRRFRKEVHRDARRRGLSDHRRSVAVEGGLVAAGLVVAVAAGLAGSTATTAGDANNYYPAARGVTVGLASLGTMAGLAQLARGESDTPAGREAAGRWLGLRDHLAENPLMAEQTPAAVAVWDRHLAYGAALGVADGVVQGVDLCAERDRMAWSSVGGRWRRVHIRYPNVLPPGWGRSPDRVAPWGVLLTIIGLFVVATVLNNIGHLIADTSDQDYFAVSRSFAEKAAVCLGIGCTIIIPIGGLGIGGWLTWASIADLAQGPETIEGRVVRLREHRKDRSSRWYLAVDDGTTNRIRAWRLSSRPTASQDSQIRVRVTRRLRHVVELQELTSPASPA